MVTALLIQSLTSSLLSFVHSALGVSLVLIFSSSRIKDRPIRIWIKLYVKKRCMLDRNSGLPGVRSRQKVSSERLCQ